jgi:hypothetical protein
VRLVLSAVFAARMSFMPHKFNADGRHKIAKQQYRVTNWAAYNESLRQRGDLTIWMSDEVCRLWSTPWAANRNIRIWRLRCA